MMICIPIFISVTSEAKIFTSTPVMATCSPSSEDVTCSTVKSELLQEKQSVFYLVSKVQRFFITCMLYCHGNFHRKKNNWKLTQCTVLCPLALSSRKKTAASSGSA